MAKTITSRTVMKIVPARISAVVGSTSGTLFWADALVPITFGPRSTGKLL